MPLVVGQNLYYVDSRGSRNWHGHVVEVVKIGRKWAELGRGYPRIDKTTLFADGGQYSSPGRCWLSEADYNAHVELDRVWHDFVRRLSHHSPDGITVERVREIAQEFGITLGQ